MARKPMITRTMKTSNVTVLCVNVDDRSTFEQNVTLPGIYKDAKKLEKAVKYVFDDSPVKPIQVIGVEVSEQLYGMSEETFLQYATKMDKR